MLALKNILVLLAKQDSGELRCPATAFIEHPLQVHVYVIKIVTGIMGIVSCHIRM